MTLEQLRSFRAIVETGSFRAAADRLHKTQPAITHQMKALEKELGHTLLDRKLVRPTPAGQRLYDRACALLSDAESLREGMRDFNETQSRELKLGTSDTTALYILPPIVRQFVKAEPNARLHIVNRPTELIAQLVTRGDLDLGIVTLPTRKPELQEQLLWEQELVLVTPKQHPLARKRHVRLDHVRNEPMLLLEPQTRTGTLLRDHFRANGIDPVVVLDTSSFDVIKRYVGEGIGIAFLPKHTITAGDTGLAIQHVPDLPRVSIGAIWRKGAYQTRASASFLKLLTDSR